MSAMGTLYEDGRDIISRLEAEGHALAVEFRAWFDRLTGHLPAVEAEAKADAEHVVAEVEHDAAPVVADEVKPS